MNAMDTREYIKLCNDYDFETWLKTRCIYDSFNNIEDRKSFRILVFNKGEETWNIFAIQHKDNIKIFHDTLIKSDDDDFIIDDETVFFIFSYPDQLKDCKLLPDALVEMFIKELKEDDED